MTRRIVTLAEVTTVMEAVVAEAGEDFVYTTEDNYYGCRYLDDGEPSCIVAHVVAAISPEAVPELDGFEFLNPNDINLSTIIFDPMAARFLTEAQIIQDRPGKTWGEALAHAKSVHN